MNVGPMSALADRPTTSVDPTSAGSVAVDVGIKKPSTLSVCEVLSR